MKWDSKKTCAAAALVLLASLPAITRADIVIDAVEAGGDVVFSYSGSIDLSGLGAPDASLNAGGVGVNAPVGLVLFGTVGSATAYDFWAGFAFPVFGTQVVLANSSTGTDFGFGGISTTTLGVFVEDGYVSGSPISGNMTFDSTSFASMGLTLGTYLVNLPDDTVTMNIGVTQVPEPATLALLGVGLAGLGFSRRKRTIK